MPIIIKYQLNIDKVTKLWENLFFIINQILNEADLVNKTDFDNKTRRFNRLITAIRTKHLEVQACH